jgi:hypothetical protein
MITPHSAFLAAVVGVLAAVTMPNAAGASYICLPFHIIPQPGAIAADGSKVKAVYTEWPMCVISTCYGPIVVFEIDADSRAIARRWRTEDQLSICGTPAQLHKHRVNIANLERGGTATATRGQIIHLPHGD